MQYIVDMGMTSLDDSILRRLEKLRAKLKPKHPNLKVTNSLIIKKALDLFEGGGCRIA